MLKTKFLNEFKKTYGKNDFKENIKNININGSKKGCSGFLYTDSKIVYINTESLQFKHLGGILYREAKSLKDYGGSHSINNYTTDLQTIKNFLLNI